MCCQNVRLIPESLHKWSLGVEDNHFEFAKEFAAIADEDSFRKLFYLYIGYEGVCSDLQKLWVQHEKSMSNNKTLHTMNNKITAQKKLLQSIIKRIQECNNLTGISNWEWNKSDFTNDYSFNLKFEQFKNNHLLLDMQPQVPLVFFYFF